MARSFFNMLKRPCDLAGRIENGGPITFSRQDSAP
jgi:hypothetical protein